MRFEGPYAAALTTILGCLFILVTAQLGHCQTVTALPAGTPRTIADYVSTIDVSAIVALDAGHAVLVGRDKGQVWIAVGCEMLKFGTANGSALVLKAFIHETRPDGSDNQSFPSEHTANAFAATGWNASISIPLAMAAGELRTAANRHWWRDVGAGALLGLGSHYLVTRIPACKGVS